MGQVDLEVLRIQAEQGGSEVSYAPVEQPVLAELLEPAIAKMSAQQNWHAAATVESYSTEIPVAEAAARAASLRDDS